MKRTRKGREDKERDGRKISCLPDGDRGTQGLRGGVSPDTTFATDPQRRAHFASVFHLLFSSLWLTGA